MQQLLKRPSQPNTAPLSFDVIPIMKNYRSRLEINKISSIFEFNLL